MRCLARPGQGKEKLESTAQFKLGQELIKSQETLQCSSVCSI